MGLSDAKPAGAAILRPFDAQAGRGLLYVREIASVLSVSLNEAFRLDKIPVNPFLKVKLPKVERVARALTPEETVDSCDSFRSSRSRLRLFLKRSAQFLCILRAPGRKRAFSFLDTDCVTSM